MIKIFTARNPAEAHLVKGILENEGIEAEVIGEALFGLRGEIPMAGDTHPAVWVLRDVDAERAAGIVVDMQGRLDQTESSGESWHCTKCGELHEAQFTQCWKCGADRLDGQ